MPPRGRSRSRSRKPATKGRSRSRSQTRDGYGTKADLARMLSPAAIRTAIATHQPKDRAWALSGKGDEKALQTRATRATLIAALETPGAAPRAPPRPTPVTAAAAAAAGGARSVALKVRKAPTTGLKRTRCDERINVDLCELDKHCGWNVAKQRCEASSVAWRTYKSALLREAKSLKRDPSWHVLFVTEGSDRYGEDAVRKAELAIAASDVPHDLSGSTEWTHVPRGALSSYSFLVAVPLDDVQLWNRVLNKAVRNEEHLLILDLADM